MSLSYTVQISKFSIIQELPNAWKNNDYKELLEAMDFGDTTEVDSADLKEMCMMSITDYEPEEAAKIVIDYQFKDRLNKGQKDNLSNEIIEEKLWEEYADLSMHEEFFNVTELLYNSFKGKFPHPEAIKFEVHITAKKNADLNIFESNCEAHIIRLLAKGMPENTLINRLFKKEVDGEDFDEAKDIIWQIKKIDSKPNITSFEVISSKYWFQDLRFIDTFNSSLTIDN